MADILSALEGKPAKVGQGTDVWQTPQQIPLSGDWIGDSIPQGGFKTSTDQFLLPSLAQYLSPKLTSSIP